MSVHYLALGPWTVAVECDLSAVHDGLAVNFGRAYSANHPPRPGILLRCQVLHDPSGFRTLANSVVFDGPEVDVSPGIKIQYAIRSPSTWFRVTQTAIVELDETRPRECRVLLQPEVAGSYTEAGKPRACPEAFFYPMLAEWIRSFGACLVHCGAAAWNGRAILLTGPPGSGKSTHVLRMLLRGAAFIADDLAVLAPGSGGLRLQPFREVANLGAGTMAVFPELSHLRDAPLRGDGKYCISIPDRFPRTAVTGAGPGVVLRLHPAETASLERVPPERALDGLHWMAWFGSRPAGNQTHFWILSDWLLQCEQWYVSRGYLQERLIELMGRFGGAGLAGGNV